MEKKIDKGLEEKKLDLIKFSYSFATGMLILTVILFFRKANSLFLFITITLSGYHLLSAALFPFLSIWSFFIVNGIFKIFSFLLTQIVFSVIYYLLITPFAFFIRLTKKDSLVFNKESTWVVHKDNDPENIKKQY